MKCQTATSVLQSVSKQRTPIGVRLRSISSLKSVARKQDVYEPQNLVLLNHKVIKEVRQFLTRIDWQNRGNVLVRTYNHHTTFFTIYTT